LSRYRVVFSARADAHLIAIRDYIAGQAGAGTADRVVNRLIERCLGLNDFPSRGTPCERLGKGVRTIPFRRSATIAYAVAGRDVVITGIAWRGQDLAALAEEGDR
jgi:toxin ParE1/3/4